MSRYAVNKALWQVARDDASATEYKEAPAKFLANRGLTDEEHRQLLARDFPGMFAAGAHPFLLFTFRIKVSGGWSYPMMVEHVKALADIDPPLDITT
jgi:phytoene dehydrogenase-like protein